MRAVERQFIEEGLRHAISGDQFTLVYQPRVDLRTLRIAAAEALIRWNHPVRGVILPSAFIPVAEDSGLIVPIGGKWVLREACRQARVWRDAGLPDLTIAVNVSAMEFLDENFLNGVFGVLDETGVDPALLELELTESVLMRDAVATEAILIALRARGIQLAVDDFGTGYSSLSYLRKFTVDSLKIDQSFIRQIIAAPAEPIVSAVISLGRSLNLRVVAEGVEKREEAEFLGAQKCGEAQGNYFSHPLPPTQFEKLLITGLAKAVVTQPSRSLDDRRKARRRINQPDRRRAVNSPVALLGGILTLADAQLIAVDRRRVIVDRRVN